MNETLNNQHQENLRPIGIEHQMPIDKGERTLSNQETDRQSHERIMAARKSIEQQALSKETVTVGSESTGQPIHHAYLTKHIKYDRYRLTLEHLRRHLNSPERQFSQLIHRPIVETASEWGSKTVARPSGILGGSFLSLLGSLIIIVIAKKVGFRVPNSIFAVLFLAGFVLGIIAEIGIASIKKLVNQKSPS